MYEIDEREDAMKGRFLTFQIENETYGIEIRNVREIIGIQAITEMPEMPEYIKGIINLRGRIIPVMDVRVRFGKSAKGYDDRTCIVVVDFNDVDSGLIVDSVSEVLSIHDENISERPKLNKNDGNGFINSIGKESGNVILLVDCGKLLSYENTKAFSSTENPY